MGSFAYIMKGRTMHSILKQTTKYILAIYIVILIAGPRISSSPNVVFDNN